MADKNEGKGDEGPKRDETDLVALVEEADEDTDGGDDPDAEANASLSGGSRSSVLPPPLPPRRVPPQMVVIGALFVVGAAAAAIYVANMFLWSPSDQPTIPSPTVVSAPPPRQPPEEPIVEAPPEMVEVQLPEVSITTDETPSRGSTSMGSGAP